MSLQDKIKAEDKKNDDVAKTADIGKAENRPFCRKFNYSLLLELFLSFKVRSKLRHQKLLWKRKNS